MRKYMIAAIFASLVLGIASSGFAATYGKSLAFRYSVIDGEVVSVDQGSRVFAIKDKDDGRVYHLSAGSNDIGSLVKGENARVTLALPGNAVTKIRR